MHPSAARRIAVLEKPTLAIKIGFLDGLTVALLASLAVPTVIGLLSTTTVSLSVLGFVGPSTAGLLLAPLSGWACSATPWVGGSPA